MCVPPVSFVVFESEAEPVVIAVDIGQTPGDGAAVEAGQLHIGDLRGACAHGEGLAQGVGGVEFVVIGVVVAQELEGVALAQAVVAPGARPVALDALAADVLLGQGGGQQGNGLAQETVKPLPGVVFPHGQFLHAIASFFGFNYAQEMQKSQVFFMENGKNHLTNRGRMFIMSFA